MAEEKAAFRLGRGLFYLRANAELFVAGVLVAGRCVVAFAGDDCEIGLIAFEHDLVEVTIVVNLIGRVGEQVLLAERAGDQAVNVVEGVLLLGFKELTAGARGDLLHDLFAIELGRCRTAGMPASAASSSAGPTTSTTWEASATGIAAATHSAVVTAGVAVVGVLLSAFEVDGEDLDAGAVG